MPKFVLTILTVVFENFFPRGVKVKNYLFILPYLFFLCLDAHLLLRKTMFSFLGWWQWGVLVSTTVSRIRCVAGNDIFFFSSMHLRCNDKVSEIKI